METSQDDSVKETNMKDRLSADEFSCHCCYELLLEPTTLTCGHSFCRHCLALWWEASRRTECPECRQTWEGFPNVNILLRSAIEKLCHNELEARRADVSSSSHTIEVLAAFESQGQLPTRPGPSSRVRARLLGARPPGSFFSGVLTGLTCVAVVLLVFHWRWGDGEEELLVHKPVDAWSTQDVEVWLSQLGDWAIPYAVAFRSAGVNGRLLLTLMEEELALPPYLVAQPGHRRALVLALGSVRELGVKPPQNLWEYKAMNIGKSLFLLYGLKGWPRLTLIYLYLFDYEDVFMPFLRSFYASPLNGLHNPESTTLLEGFCADQVLPLKQWIVLALHAIVVPYIFLGRAALTWLDVHFWTACFVIVNTVLLTLLEAFSLRRAYTQGRLLQLPRQAWGEFWRLVSQVSIAILLWPLVPRFVCDCLFHWALYFNPIINLDLVTKELQRLMRQQH
uniref:bifunctional apoptosis regulator n=1 Tax=Myxine glutinosa TaxID=7769 RepID=UPI00358E892F